MATKKRLANRFKAEYAKASKKQKGEVLDRLVAVGMGRSTARRLLSQAVRAREKPGPGRGCRPGWSRWWMPAFRRRWTRSTASTGVSMQASAGPAYAGVYVQCSLGRSVMVFSA